LKADLVLLNGSVYTLDKVRPWAEAVAVSGGRIQWAGSNQEALELLGPRTRTLDLLGKVVAPAFTDAHLHLVYWGLSERWLPLNPADTAEEVLAEMEFKPLVANPIEELAPPTPEELRILREEIDPSRAVIGRTAE